VLTKFQAVASAGAETVRTDIPQSMLGYFVDLAGKTRALPIQTVELTPEAGIEPAYPDWDLVHGLIRDAIVSATAQPTPPATETG
jgi:hypothetical protein